DTERIFADKDWSDIGVDEADDARMGAARHRPAQGAVRGFYLQQDRLLHGRLLAEGRRLDGDVGKRVCLDPRNLHQRTLPDRQLALRPCRNLRESPAGAFMKYTFSFFVSVIAARGGAAHGSAQPSVSETSAARRKQRSETGLSLTLECSAAVLIGRDRRPDILQPRLVRSPYERVQDFD